MDNIIIYSNRNIIEIDRDEKIVKKYYRGRDRKTDFDSELKALTKLNGLCSPKIISYDKKNIEITMEYIPYEKIDLYDILNSGNKAIYNYAKALYNLKNILIENEIDPNDDKNEHQLYDLKNNKLWCIDYDVALDYIDEDAKNELNKQFDFLNKPNYSNCSSFKSFIEYLNKKKCKV